MSIAVMSPSHSMVLAIAVGFALIANPVLAQDMDHSKMTMPMPMPKPAAKTPVPAKKAAVKAPVKKSPAKKAPARKLPAAADTSMQGMDHSTMPMPAADTSMEGMDHSSMPMPADDSMQGMDHSTMPMPANDASMPGMDHSSMPMPTDDDSMQGMDHSTMEGMDHAGMTMPITEPREPIPILTDADRAAAFQPVAGHAMHDNTIQSYVLLDRLEAWNADQGTGFEWEGQGWIGTDLNRLWLRSEGEHVDGQLEAADLEVLYGRSIAAWWDLVAGIRHDFKPGAAQDFAAIGVIGMTPYKYEVEATAYISPSGQTAARVEVEYETLLTNRLVLQPLIEVNLYGQDDQRRGIGSGLSTVEAGLRLRYEFTRKFAPYIGVVRERAFGRTVDFRRDEGNAIDDTRFVAGIRIWF